MKNIVLCGSMTFISKMKEIAKSLSENGFTPIIPDEDNWGILNESEKNEYKRKVSRAHFDKIACQDTYAILVINERKNNKDNYIGANTFAEIALAFYFGKKIYILYGLYEPYSDELLAWGALRLNGKLQNII